MHFFQKVGLRLPGIPLQLTTYSELIEDAGGQLSCSRLRVFFRRACRYLDGDRPKPWQGRDVLRNLIVLKLTYGAPQGQLSFAERADLHPHRAIYAPGSQHLEHECLKIGTCLLDHVDIDNADLTG